VRHTTIECAPSARHPFCMPKTIKYQVFKNSKYATEIFVTNIKRCSQGAYCRSSRSCCKSVKYCREVDVAPGLGFSFPGTRFRGVRESRSFSVPEFPVMERARSRRKRERGS